MHHADRLRADPLEVDAPTARALMAIAAAPFLLDVREPDEYRWGHIAGAALIPLGQLDARLAELPRDRRILCICRSGARSLTATRRLLAAGYAATNLRGGMLGWADAGLPIRRSV